MFAVREMITYIFTIMIVLFGVTAAFTADMPDISRSASATPLETGITLSKALAGLNNIDDGEKSIEFSRPFRITIKNKGKGDESDTLKEYEITVVGVDENGNQAGESFVDDFVSNIPACDNTKCVYVCTRFGMVKEGDEISLNCYNEKINSFTGETDIASYRPCPYSTKDEEERMIREIVETYAPKAAEDAGVPQDLFIAVIKAIMKYESVTFNHCDDEGRVLVGYSGDIGIMQINPKWYGYQYDLEGNIKAGINILRKNIKEFEGYREKLRLAIAYYNCGGTKSKAIPEDGRGIEIKWDSRFKKILTKYCSNNNADTSKYVDAVWDLKNYYLPRPDCYRYPCLLA